MKAGRRRAAAAIAMVLAGVAVMPHWGAAAHETATVANGSNARGGVATRRAPSSSLPETDGHGGPSYGARRESAPGARIPVRAVLTASSVRAGGRQTLQLVTTKGVRVLLQVSYARRGGFKKRGKADASGRWRHSWLVHAPYTGRAAAALTLFQGKRRRHYTLHFIVTAPPPKTPTPIPESTLPSALTSTPVPTPVQTPAVTSTPISPDAISFSAMGLYSNIGTSGPAGAPQTSFPSTIPTIYAWATFSQWRGYHDVEFDWYDPNGNLYAIGTDKTTANGPSSSQSSIDVAGQAAAKLNGQWTLEVSVDGKSVASQKFSL